jgi:LuxR family transcriptional regulator, maltose regulon positive regulatory protein
MNVGEHVLRTKSLPPTQPSTILIRSRLWRQLDAVVHSDVDPNLALLVAPSGFGKTTLLSSWQASLRALSRPIAWCSLDDTDVDTFHFWSSVLAALSLTGDALATRVKGLAAPHLPGNRDFLAALTEALADQGVVIIMENLHEVTDVGVVSDLNRFVGNLPDDLVLIMSTRSDPPLRALQSIKLAGGLTQIRASELAFQPNEVTRWCQELSAEQARSIWEWTEGWPAMVRLMDMQVRAGIDVPTQLANTDFGLADHLFYEAFRRRPEDVRRTLMFSAVPDAVTLDLAVQLSGHENAGQILEGVAQESGLLTRTAHPALQETVYRLHPMLRTYLYGELLRTDRLAAQTAQRVTSQWCVGAGLSLSAVKHAVASGDCMFLDSIVRGVGPGLINAGRAGALLHVLTNSTRRDSPVWTALICAVALLDVDRLEEAEVQMHLVRHGLAGSDASDDPLVNCPDLEVAWRAARVHLQRRQGSRELLPQIEPLSDNHDLDLRLLLATQRGSVGVWAGDLCAAEEELRLGIRIARGLNRTAALIDCLSYLGGLHASRSETDAMISCVEEALELGETHGWADTPRMAYPHLLKGWAAFQQLDQELAQQHIERAENLLGPNADPIIRLSAEALSTALRFLRQDSPIKNSDNFHHVFRQLDQLHAPPAILAHLALLDVAMSLPVRRLRHVQEAREVLQTNFGDCGELRLLEAMTKRASGHHAEARRTLAAVLPKGREFLVPLAEVEAWVLAASLAYVDDEVFLATEFARKALVGAAHTHGLAPLIAGGEEFEDLLRANVGRWGAHESLVELVLNRSSQKQVAQRTSLTSRELDILQELPNLNTVDEIADALCVSANTVKTHLRSVYRKLNVSSRRAAVTEARRLRLL